MKRIALYIALTTVVFAMASCDKLKEPYCIEPVVQVSDTIFLVDADTANFDGKVVVLLEDFTGVKCTNCPNAAVIANSLIEQYPGHLVVLGVHPNSGLTYQDPQGGFPDFRTVDGEVWRQQFNIQSFPNGLVNRAGVVSSSNWATEVANVIDSNAPARLIVKTEFDEATRELKISAHTLIMQDIASHDVRIIVCMMEDNIVGKQVTSSGVNNEYMHRHVFRGTVDGLAWGRPLDMTGPDVMEAGRRFVTNMKFTLNDEYNADEFYIVAFISDNLTKEVLMAAERKIK